MAWNARSVGLSRTRSAEEESADEIDAIKAIFDVNFSLDEAEIAHGTAIAHVPRVRLRLFPQGQNKKEIHVTLEARKSYPPTQRAQRYQADVA